MSRTIGMSLEPLFIVNFLRISCRKVRFEHSHNAGGLKIYIGEDPRDVPETYLRWYCNQMDILDVRDGIYQELITVLGDRYDQQRVETLIQQLEQSSDVGEFIKQLMEPWGNEYQGQPTLLPGAQSSHLDLPTDDNSNNNNRLPERAEQILRDFCQQGGLELPQAMEQLVQILGPGSDSVSRKLLTLLGSDPSSDMLDTATAEAIYDLNELKRGNLGGKRMHLGTQVCLF